MNILCHILADFVGWWQTFLYMVIIEWTELEHILERMCTSVEHNWDIFWKTLIAFGLVFHRLWTHCVILRHILSVFWTDLEMILYGFSTDFVLISSRIWTDYIWKLLIVFGLVLNIFWTYCAILRHILSVFWTDLEMILYGFSTDFVLISRTFSTILYILSTDIEQFFGQILIRLWKDFAETADIFWRFFDHVLNIL